MARTTPGHIAFSKAEVARHAFNLADSAICTPDLASLGLPYQAGLPREGYAIQDTLERALGVRTGAPGGRVLVAAGASEANAMVFSALLSPGDEVLVERPGYEPHRAVPAFFGAQVRSFVRPREGDFLGVAAAVEEAIGPATRMVVFSHLHNPSGASLPQSEADALESLASRRAFRLLADETFRDSSRLPLGTLSARGPAWVATSSLTKSYGLGGLRIGWVAGSDDVLARCAAAQNALSVQPALPSLALALALVPHLDSLRERTHRILARNHAAWQALVVRRASAARGAPDFDLGPMPAGTTAWCRATAPDGGDAFAEFASRSRGLAVTPGRFFGDPQGFRVGLGFEPDTFGAALATLELAMADFVAAGAGAGASR